MTSTPTSPRLASVRFVTVTFCAAFLGLGALQGWLYYRMAVREGADREQERSQRVQLNLEALLADVQRAGTAARHHAATGDERQMKTFAEASAAVPGYLAAIRSAAAEDPSSVAGLNVGEVQRLADAALADARRELGAVPASRPGGGPPPPPAPVDRLLEVVPAAADAEDRMVGRQGTAEQASVRNSSAAFVAVAAAELLLLALAFRAVQVYAAHRRRAEAALEASRRSAEADRATAEAAKAGAEAATAAAEAANRAKDRVLTTVSHDLRTPLGSILLWAEAAGRQTVGGPVRAALDAITRSAKDQSRLVDDLLDAARTARGTFRVDRAPVDLPDVVRRGCEAVRPTADAKGVALDVTLPTAAEADGATTLGDAFRLGQVVWNLVGNAVKFTPAGGRVAVSLARDAATGWRLTVRDTGPGIPPVDLPRLFDPFYQAAQANRPAAGGIGMGLAIAKRVVELHGGTIDVRGGGGDGEGATFSVTIPNRYEGGRTLPPQAAAQA